MDHTLTTPRGDLTRRDLLKAYSLALEIHGEPDDDRLAEAIINEAVGEGNRDVASAPLRDVIERLARIGDDVRCMIGHLDSLLCSGCQRRMDLGEPHTASCPAALWQDAEDAAPGLHQR